MAAATSTDRDPRATPDDAAPPALDAPALDDEPGTGMAFMGGGILGVSLVFLAVGGVMRALERWEQRSRLVH